jgi:ATP-dependent Clp protease ATP-binding subunit ClpA
VTPPLTPPAAAALERARTAGGSAAALIVELVNARSPAVAHVLDETGADAEAVAAAASAAPQTSPSVDVVARAAAGLATDLGHPFVGSEHLLIAALEADATAGGGIASAGLDARAARTVLF